LPEYLAPGVFVEETSFRSRTIQGVGTATALFIGEHRQGPVGKLVPVTGTGDYEAVFGEIGDAADSLGLAMHAFFSNGGRRACVVRMADAATAADYETFYRGAADELREIDVIVHHDQAWAAGGAGNAVISATIAFCEAAGHCMVIVDPPRDHTLATTADVAALAPPDSSYACLYYPWLDLQAPAGLSVSGGTLTVPPSACAAGIWARIDGTRGVWKAPAGPEARVAGAVGPLHPVDSAAQRELNPHGINCIRKFPSRGTLVWGARTLATRSRPEWRYIPVRRTGIYIRESIGRGIQWAVFEPNAPALWHSLREVVGNFMEGLWRSGALPGDRPDEAFYVRCGLGDTMTQSDVDRGQVIIELGFAAVKPAEFVVLRIVQKTASPP
jgi:phage tail sheath protein FI